MEQFSEDECRFCGKHLGYGIELFHLGLCEDPECRKLDKLEEEGKTDMSQAGVKLDPPDRCFIGDQGPKTFKATEIVPAEASKGTGLECGICHEEFTLGAKAFRKDGVNACIRCGVVIGMHIDPKIEHLKVLKNPATGCPGFVRQNIADHNY